MRSDIASSDAGVRESGVIVAVTGAAGLVGQNLIARLIAAGGHEIIAIDKHPANLRILKTLHPAITAIEADLAVPGAWEAALDRADSVVIAHAQIGGLYQRDFIRNNITATERVLAAIARCGGRHLVHISSSAVNSAATDWYCATKQAQEALVLASGNPAIVLRPSLMFGWFDRKHLGWLARFMRRSPVFPVPGSGDYLRQPLYVGDLCRILITCLEQRRHGAAYNITGQDKISYIRLITMIRDATKARTAIVRIPHWLFWLMLSAYALTDRNPPFTTRQLKALRTADIFETIDWPGIFDLRPTPLADAIRETFQHPVYSSIALAF